MKTRWLLGIVALIAAMLACKDPFEKEPIFTATTIKSVGVTPLSGSGSFTLEVSYETFWIPDKFIPNIYCNYVAPNGTIVPIGKVDMFDHIGARTVVAATKTLPFTVAQTNGVTQPGTYLAGCTTERNSTPVTTTFVVIGDATPMPELPSNSVPTPTATLQAATLKGRIVFDYNTYQSTRPSGGGELDRVTKWCIPDVTITPDGFVSGTCEFSGTAFLAQSTVTAHITGIAVQGGSFSFSYVVTEQGSNGWNLKPGENPSVPVWSNEAKWEISYTGSGNFTSATQASGTATFDFSCDSGADNLIWCNSQTHEAFSGTVLWSFVPAP